MPTLLLCPQSCEWVDVLFVLGVGLLTWLAELQGWEVGASPGRDQGMGLRLMHFPHDKASMEQLY